MLPVATAGYRVVAPDQRGYGRTTGWDADYDAHFSRFRVQDVVRDALWLVSALGYREAAMVAGHDFGASAAGSCALVRPDVFRSMALMSSFSGPPALAFHTADNPPQPKPPEPNIHNELAKLHRRRKHYQWYYSTSRANVDMWHCPQGVHAFLKCRPPRISPLSLAHRGRACGRQQRIRAHRVSGRAAVVPCADARPQRL